MRSGGRREWFEFPRPPDLNVSVDASETRATDEQGVSTWLQIQREVPFAVRLHSGGCVIGGRQHADVSIADTHALRLHSPR